MGYMMAEICCKRCDSPDCHGCNMYRLEQMLKSGKFNNCMDKNHGIKTDVDIAPVIHAKWAYNDGDYIPYCTNCMMPQDMETPFCHSCGANMREEKNGKTVQ